jgi:putative membrane protein
MAGLLGTRQRNRDSELVSLLLQWLILAAAVWAAAELIDEIALEGWKSTLAVAGILGLLNLAVKPVLQALSLPLTFITLGLFLLVINTVVFALAARIAFEFDEIQFAVAGIPGDFFWEGFKNAFAGALVVTVVTWVLGMIVDSAAR